MPRTGPCAPWIAGDDVAGLASIRLAIASYNQKALQANPNLPTIGDEAVQVICAEAASGACEVLYSLTGRQFTGNCGPVTIRPVQRPQNADTRGWVYAGGGGWGYGWGNSANNLGLPPVMALYAEDQAPTVELYDYPVNEILEVKINGVIIPPIEYELREHKWLLRVIPTPSYVPTEMYGWPTSQVQYYPDTEQGTFSVTYTFGQDPGTMGRIAALALAENIAMPFFGDANRYPTRTTHISRQGVEMDVASVIDIMKTGGTGIRTVDQWILAVNPNKLRKRPIVSSPDISRSMRTRRPSVN